MELGWSSVTFPGLALAAALLCFPVRSQGIGQPAFRNFVACDTRTNLGVTATVFIQGCAQPVCVFCKKTSVDIQIKFSSPSDTTDLYACTYVLLKSARIKAGKEVDVCSCTVSLAGPKCSDTNGLRQGMTYVYIRTFNVKESIPKINATVEIQLYGKAENSKVPIACVRIPVQIKDCPGVSPP